MKAMMKAKILEIREAYELIELLNSSYEETFSIENDFSVLKRETINIKYQIENKYCVTIVNYMCGGPVFVRFYTRMFGTHFQKVDWGRSVSFEEVFNNVSNDAKKIFLYNLDLFK